MAGGAACLSNSNTRIIVCQIVTYVIIVRQIRIYRFFNFEICRQTISSVRSCCCSSVFFHSFMALIISEKFVIVPIYLSKVIYM